MTLAHIANITHATELDIAYATNLEITEKNVSDLTKHNALAKNTLEYDGKKAQDLFIIAFKILEQEEAYTEKICNKIIALKTLEQEEAHIKHVCDVTIAFKPDLVITEKRVSDLAQHLISKAIGYNALTKNALDMGIKCGALQHCNLMVTIALKKTCTFKHSITHSALERGEKYDALEASGDLWSPPLPPVSTKQCRAAESYHSTMPPCYHVILTIMFTQ